MVQLRQRSILIDQLTYLFCVFHVTFVCFMWLMEYEEPFFYIYMDVNKAFCHLAKAGLQNGSSLENGSCWNCAIFLFLWIGDLYPPSQWICEEGSENRSHNKWNLVFSICWCNKYIFNPLERFSIFFFKRRRTSMDLSWAFSLYKIWAPLKIFNNSLWKGATVMSQSAFFMLSI